MVPWWLISTDTNTQRNRDILTITASLLRLCLAVRATKHGLVFCLCALVILIIFQRRVITKIISNHKQKWATRTSSKQALETNQSIIFDGEASGCWESAEFGWLMLVISARNTRKKQSWSSDIKLALANNQPELVANGWSSIEATSSQYYWTGNSHLNIKDDPKCTVWYWQALWAARVKWLPGTPTAVNHCLGFGDFCQSECSMLFFISIRDWRAMSDIYASQFGRLSMMGIPYQKRQFVIRTNQKSGILDFTNELTTNQSGYQKCWGAPWIPKGFTGLDLFRSSPPVDLAALPIGNETMEAPRPRGSAMPWRKLRTMIWITTVTNHWAMIDEK